MAYLSPIADILKQASYLYSSTVACDSDYHMSEIKCLWKDHANEISIFIIVYIKELVMYLLTLNRQYYIRILDIINQIALHICVSEGPYTWIKL